MNLELFHDLKIISRLTHVEAEVRKCTWDYWVFSCPKCQRNIRLEYLAFKGVQQVSCECCEVFQFNFSAVVDRWPGPGPKVTEELL